MGYVGFWRLDGEMGDVGEMTTKTKDSSSCEVTRTEIREIIENENSRSCEEKTIEKKDAKLKSQKTELKTS